MTDAEVLKALECCGSTTVGACKDCTMYKDKSGICVPIICRDAFDLINRQKAEIERLKKENAFHRKTITENAQRALEVTVEEIEKAKSEARKEFAERLRKTMTATSKTISGYCKYIVTDDEIDNLLEEMEGNDG